MLFLLFLSDPSTFGAGGETRLESKFWNEDVNPHFIYDWGFSSVRNGGTIPKSGPPGGGGGGGPANCTILDKGLDYFVTPSKNLNSDITSADDCCKACAKDGNWNFFTYTGQCHASIPREAEGLGCCWCHDSTGQKKPHKDYISGSCRNAPPPAPTPPSSGVTTYATLRDVQVWPANPVFEFVNTMQYRWKTGRRVAISSPTTFSLVQFSTLFSGPAFPGVSMYLGTTFQL